MSLSALSALIGCAAGFILAVWVILQRQEQRARWAFALGMLSFAAEAAFSYLCLRSETAIDVLTYQTGRMASMAASIGPWVYFSLVYARGDAAAAVKTWRWGLGAATIVPLFIVIAFADSLVISIQPSAYGFIPAMGLGLPALALHGAGLAGCVLVLMNLERTYRASVGTLRWRIKFMVLGLVVLFVVRLLIASHAILYEVLNARLDNLNSVALALSSILIGRTLLRSGHFEIELYPSQSLLRNSVTFLIVGVYLAIAGVAAKFFSSVGTDFDVPRASLVLLVALIVLLIGLASDRVRLVVLRFVSRHFQRPLYDYRAVWRQFTEATRSPRSQEELGRKIVHAVAEVFQVQSSSLWVYDEHDKIFRPVASTAQPTQQSEAVRPSPEESALLLRTLSTMEDPLPFETSEEPWADILRRCHPAEFLHGGNRACTALLHNNEPIGVLIVGDRIGGVEFRAQDFDMLKCIGDHVTASLLNVQLSRQLIQARELEAFQTMAAFFVHDLKNAASTLNLMLPNLKTYWDTPGFRDDALRGIGKTVDHINTLVSRLSQLRGELDVTPTPTPLGSVLAEWLRTLTPKPGLTFTVDIKDLPVCLVDADQMRKVVTNLVLNAFDATPPPGRIDFSAALVDGWIQFSVKDTGKGIAPEFLQRSLFRPFQTTKKGGLGIGLFHTRMIVEAHGGRISATSQPGQGTTFTVVLPLRSPASTLPDGEK